MTMQKRINALIRELCALEGGKIQLDAPMGKATIKALARLIHIEGTKGAFSMGPTIELLLDYADTFEKKQNAKAKQGAKRTRA